MHAIPSFARTALAVGLALVAAVARGDVVTDWNIKANQYIAGAGMGPPPAYRAMAISQVAVYDAVNAITGRYPSSGRAGLEAAPGASIEAAVAAAVRGTLGKLLVSRQADIETAYQAALAAVPEGPARSAGVAVGEKSAAAVMAWRGGDGAAAPDIYVPFTMAGAYVPTVSPAVPHWGRRKPWILSSGDQFRPGPPPALTSELWARDYNEIKALGGKASTQRSAAQTEVARFWDASLPVIYHPLARSVALQPGREVTQNARLLAVVAMAMDDGLIAVFDAKYTYNFWRPVTAIRNGDKDGNDATQRDPAWASFIDTPLHPEYPCAHCVVGAALGAVLQAEIGNGPIPPLATTSPTAPGVTRVWATIAEFTQEVASARIYDGVHFRNSTEVGAAIGKKVGEMAAARFLQ